MAANECWPETERAVVLLLVDSCAPDSVDLA